MRIDSLEVHKDIVKKVMEGRHLPDVFLETKFPDRIPGEKTSTYIKKTVSAVRRLVRKRMPEERGERVAYIADMLGLDPSEVVIEPLDRDSFAHQIVMGTCTVTNSADLIVRIPFPVHDEKYQYVYLHLYDKMKPSYHRTVRKYSRVEMDYIPVADLESYLAEHALLKAIQHYVSEDPGRIKMALFDYSIEGDTLNVRYYSEEAAKMLEAMMPDYGIEKLVSRKAGASYAFKDYATGKLDVMAGDFRAPFREIVPLLIALAGEVVDVRNLIKDAAISMAAYAKAFQTKKNIPKAHLERMRDNAFLKVYGYVELDEDVDLDKFSVIEANLFDFVRATGMQKADDHSFRVKRLGNYKAAGIYFSGHNATIFDLRHPQAFGHEWMHQIDYTLRGTGRNVHEESEFHPLYVRYQQLVEQAIEQAGDDEPIKSSWKGSTKFNRSYYMKKTEVFARLGEVYLSTVVDDSNSLVQPRTELESSLVHPTDEVTERLVVDFFQKLFGAKEKNRRVS